MYALITLGRRPKPCPLSFGESGAKNSVSAAQIPAHRKNSRQHSPAIFLSYPLKKPPRHTECGGNRVKGHRASGKRPFCAGRSGEDAPCGSL